MGAMGMSQRHVHAAQRLLVEERFHAFGYPVQTIAPVGRQHYGYVGAEYPGKRPQRLEQSVRIGNVVAGAMGERMPATPHGMPQVQSGPGPAPDERLAQRD